DMGIYQSRCGVDRLTTRRAHRRRTSRSRLAARRGCYATGKGIAHRPPELRPDVARGHEGTPVPHRPVVAPRPWPEVRTQPTEAKGRRHPSVYTARPALGSQGVGGLGSGPRTVT